MEKVPSIPAGSKIRVKLSGDGAQFSRSSHYVLLSFSFPGLAGDVLCGSGKLTVCRLLDTTVYCQYVLLLGNHTFAAVKGSESYELLSSAFAPVFQELNEAIVNPCVEINGVHYELDLVFGSDYKVCY